MKLANRMTLRWYALCALSAMAALSSVPLKTATTTTVDTTTTTTVFAISSLDLLTTASPAPASKPYNIDWAPTGDCLAVGSLGVATDNIVLYRPTGSALSRVGFASFGGGVWGLRWHPSGRFLAVVGDPSTSNATASVQVYRVENDALTLNGTWQLTSGKPLTVDWHPNGQLLLITEYAGGAIYLGRFDPVQGLLASPIKVGAMSAAAGVNVRSRTVRWRSDGNYFATVDDYGLNELQVYSFDSKAADLSKAVALVARMPVPGAADCRWTKDGAYVIAVNATAPYQLVMYRFTGTALTESWKGSLAAASRGVDISQDGNYVIASFVGGLLVYGNNQNGTLTQLYTLALAADSWNRLAISPDGSKVAVPFYGTSTLSLYGITKTGSAANTISAPTTVLKPSAPAVQSPAPVTIGQASVGNSKSALTTGCKGFGWVRWSPDSQYVAVGESYGDVTGRCLVIYQMVNGSLVQRATYTHSTTVNYVEWHPSGKYLAIQGRVLKFDGTSLVALTNGAFTPSMQISWHPSGNYLAAAMYKNNTAVCYEFANEKVTQLTSLSHDTIVYVTAWHPSGQFLVMGDYYNAVCNLRVFAFSAADKSFKEIMTARYTLGGQTARAYHGITWSSDGKYLGVPGHATADGYGFRILSFNGTAFTELSETKLLEKYIYARDVSWLDGSHYVVLGHSSASLHEPFRLFRFDGISLFEIKLAITSLTINVWSVAASPDNRYIAVAGFNTAGGTHLAVYPVLSGIPVAAPAVSAVAAAVTTVTPTVTASATTTLATTTAATATTAPVPTATIAPASASASTTAVAATEMVGLDLSLTISAQPAAAQRECAWSADGRYFATAIAADANSNVAVYRRDAKQMTLVATASPGCRCWDVNWHPSGRYLAVSAFTAPLGQLYRFVDEKLTLIWSSAAVGSNCFNVRWSPSGNHMLFAAAARAPVIVPFTVATETVGTPVSLAATGLDSRGLAWHPSGNFFAVSGKQAGVAAVKVYSFDMSKLTATLVASDRCGDTGYGHGCDFSRTGNYLAVSCYSGSFMGVKMFAFSSTALKECGSFADQTSAYVNFSHDDNYLVCVISGQVRVLRIQSGGSLQEITAMRGGSAISCARFSPDDSMIGCSGSDASIKVFPIKRQPLSTTSAMTSAAAAPTTTPATTTTATTPTATTVTTATTPTTATTAPVTPVVTSTSAPNTTMPSIVTTATAVAPVATAAPTTTPATTTTVTTPTATTVTTATTPTTATTDPVTPVVTSTAAATSATAPTPSATTPAPVATAAPVVATDAEKKTIKDGQMAIMNSVAQAPMTAPAKLPTIGACVPSQLLKVPTDAFNAKFTAQASAFETIDKRMKAVIADNSTLEMELKNNSTTLAKLDPLLKALQKDVDGDGTAALPKLTNLITTYATASADLEKQRAGVKTAIQTWMKTEAGAMTTEPMPIWVAPAPYATTSYTLRGDAAIAMRSLKTQFETLLGQLSDQFHALMKANADFKAANDVVVKMSSDTAMTLDALSAADPCKLMTDLKNKLNRVNNELKPAYSTFDAATRATLDDLRLKIANFDPANPPQVALVPAPEAVTSIGTPSAPTNVTAPSVTSAGTTTRVGRDAAPVISRDVVAPAVSRGVYSPTTTRRGR